MIMGTIRPIVRSCTPLAGLLAAVVLLTLPAYAATPAKLSGALAGAVTNTTGIPQMGATVLLYNRQERLCERALTDAEGKFSFASLLPDVYSIRVSLPAFVTAFKDNILVQPGVRSLLNVSLASLFSSIQLVAPASGEPAVMSEDWKWVLRTASATRPILRVLPGWTGIDPNAQPRHTTTIFSETRGLVRVSGGDGGQASGSGDAADLGTAFALATSLFGANQLQVSGNLGYTPQSGMPSAGFRTTYSRSIGGVSPEVSLTMRQLFLPRIGDALAGGPAAGGVPALRTMALNIANETALSESLRLQYGFSLDSVTFLDRLHYFSPYARLSYALPRNSELDFAFTSGNGRPDLARQGAAPDMGGLQQDINALSRVPRVSLLHGRPQVQRGENFEVGYSRVIGSRTYRLSGYREQVSNAALTIVAPGGLYTGGDILPDMFSNSSIFNAGNYHTLGYTASVTQKMGEHMNLTMMYGSVGVLTPLSNEVPSENPDDLRSMIRSARRNAVTMRTALVIPGIGTHVVTSYQWMDQRSATPGQLYSTEQIRPDPGLNIYVRQPIPSGFNLPWRMEATADLRNMLAQGYLPLSLADGRRILLIQNPRTFRGGLSFIF